MKYSMDQTVVYQVMLSHFDYGNIELYVVAENPRQALSLVYEAGRVLGSLEQHGVDIESIPTIQFRTGECPVYSDFCCKTDEQLYCGKLTRIGRGE